MPVPRDPKIYHIVHIDRLQSIIADECLWCDSETSRLMPAGTTIGMGKIKQRRLGLKLTSYPDLNVGDCVPFYFCPRSIMLFLIHMGNDEELAYRDGQEPIVHLESDLHQAVNWAKQHNHRWAFTLSNAGAYYFEDRCDLARLDEINWDAVRTNQWGGRNIHGSVKEGKQAEFLFERSFPWELFTRIGVINRQVYGQVQSALRMASHKPRIEIKRDWYYRVG